MFPSLTNDHTDTTADAATLTSRARQYLLRIPPAVSGCGGDVATYRAAQVLVRGFGLEVEAALPLLEEWNAACDPPWPQRALRTKLISASRSRRPAGYLRDDRQHGRPWSRQGPGRGRESRPAESPVDRPRSWPSFQPLTVEDTAVIAAGRGVSVRAVEILSRCGWLWRCRWRGQECWAVHSEGFAQVRCMDGRPFAREDGGSVKALSLPGSRGAFLHPGLAADHAGPVLLTEGAASLLESVEIILRASATAGRLRPLALYAAVSAGSRLSDELLTALAGRRVLILPDADPAGLEGAARWTAALRSAGCTVCCRSMPPGCKDPGDALRCLPSGHPCWQALLSFP